MCDKYSHLKSSPLRLSFQCPNCDAYAYFSPEVTAEDTNNVSSTECNACNSWLMIEGNRVYDANELLHEDSPLWPADGNNTGHISL